MAIAQFKEKEINDQSWEEIQAFMKDVQAFMDEFRINAYRKDGSLDQ